MNTNKENKQNKENKGKIEANENSAASPFGRSKKMMRSPVLAGTSKSSETAKLGTPLTTRGDTSEPETPKIREDGATPCNTMEANCASGSAATGYSSPRQEFILKMRRSEEEALGKCHKVLRKIRLAMNKQRNINMDVQNGVSELEELFDVIGNYRRNWKAAEKERQESRNTPAAFKVSKTLSREETAPASKNKRAASSPADSNPGKKQKETNTREEVEVKEPKRQVANATRKPKRAPRKKKRPKRLKSRPEAVIIKPQEGHSFADVLKTLRQNVKPEETDVAVQSIRKTKTGAILLVMGKGGKKDEFRDMIKGTLKETAAVDDLTPKGTIEIQDLDALSTAEEVINAVTKATDLGVDNITAHLTPTNNREQRRAFVTLPIAGVNKLLERPRIKIGWTNCRIKYREAVKRCFRCFDSGHMQHECRGPNRKEMGMCIRCGELGHKLKECKNTPKCCICSQEGKAATDHMPGSRNCKRIPQR